MAKVNDALLSRLERQLGLSRNRVYRLIAEKVNETHLPRPLAAIVLASEKGVNISKFASEEDLAILRQAARGQVSPLPSAVVVPEVAGRKTGKTKKSRPAAKKTKKAKSAARRSTRGSSVFVVHGRNLKARDALFTFLRALNLHPIEWLEAVKKTNQASPYVSTIVETAFRDAAAIVVLLTPDDEARLRKPFRQKADPKHETKLTGQARANVLFEAGMAFGRNSKSTLLVQIGDLRPFSDVAGRHILRMDGSPQKRQEFATKLQSAGCAVDTTAGTDWLTAGNFQFK